MTAGFKPRRVALMLALVLVAGLAAVAPASAAKPFCDVDLTTSPNCYVAVDDGAVIAMSVKIPAHCTEAKPCPTVFEMAGYENGTAEGQTTTGEFGGPGAPLADDSRQLTRMFDADYATVHASVRGTGCSGGEFDLFSLRSARDGAWIIDNWIANQDWSNGDVAIMGHSYSGITGFMVASQRPEHLEAITVSGLIDDLYRGITYIGGVSNMGFPPLWTLGVRQAYDFIGGLAQGLGRPIWRNAPPLNPDNQTFNTEGQAGQCATNMSTRGRTVINDPVIQGGLGDTDGTWWQVRALATFAHRINVPTHIAGSYQDEQTGPRGFTRLWEMVRADKRLLIGNGQHGTQQSGYYMADRKAWIDYHLRGVGAEPPDRSVTVLQEFRGNAPQSVITDDQFPLEDTKWTDYYFRAGSALSTTRPGAAEGSVDYVSGSGRQAWFWETGRTLGSPFTTADGPDEATFSTMVTQNTTIAGPITATLRLSSSAPDTELFVQLIDEAPDGSRQFLQRGILKASHRAIDVQRSDCVKPSDDNKRVDCLDDNAHMYRPHRPHTNPMLVTPGEAVDYLIEIFPVSHTFRPGHKITVKVMAPPAADSYYVYVNRTARGVNTILLDGVSKITLPVVPHTPAPEKPGCRGDGQAQAADNVRCIAKPNG